jgi:hypothetical protein
MVVSPSSSHSFGIPVVWNDVVVVRELFVANCAYSLLFANFPLQKFPHFSGRPELSISPRMMRIFNAANPGLYRADTLRLLATAAAK